MGAAADLKSALQKTTVRLTDAISSVLFVGGRGNGVAVVATEEDQWALEGG